jgi:hypothetical protein
MITGKSNDMQCEISQVAEMAVKVVRLRYATLRYDTEGLVDN